MTQELVINGALITLLFLVVGPAVKITRTQAADNAALKQTIVEQDKEHAAEIARMQREHGDQLDTLRREFGEVANALRTKVHEVETWARDEFVRKGSFELVIARMEKMVESLGEKLDKRLDKIEERFDKKVQG